MLPQFVRCFRSGGDFHLLEISYLNFGQKYPKMMKKSCFILPTCNRKVAISYLQNCGVLARSVTCGGAVGKLRLLYLSTSGFLQDQLISWIFLVLLPRKFNMVHLKLDQNGKDFIPPLETILFRFHVSF